MRKKNTLAKVFAFLALFGIIGVVAGAGISVLFPQGPNYERNATPSYLDSVNQQAVPVKNFKDALNKENTIKVGTGIVEKEEVIKAVMPAVEKTATGNIQ